MLFVLGPMHHIPSFIKSFLFPFSPPPSFHPLLPTPFFQAFSPNRSLSLPFLLPYCFCLFVFLPIPLSPLLGSSSFPSPPFLFSLHPIFYFSPLSLSRPLSLSLCIFFPLYILLCHYEILVFCYVHKISIQCCD